MQYRRLEKGEIIQKGDQCDQCVNPWKDKPKWENVVGNIGEPAPDPAFPSHRQYRRPVYPSGYERMRDALANIWIWAESDSQSGETREKAMADIAKACREGLHEYGERSDSPSRKERGKHE